MKSIPDSASSNPDASNDSKDTIIAIDLGGTMIKYGLFLNGQLAAHKEMNALARTGLKPQLPKLRKAVDGMLDEMNLPKNRVLGLGFAFPGIVDPHRNIILSTNKKYDDGPDTSLTAWAREIWDCPLFAMNDARMALLGEWQIGAGMGCNNLVMLTLGTGIGSAVLIDGKLLLGKHYQAGNLGGHFTINFRGITCTCGNTGCVESEASTWRLPSLFAEHPQINADVISTCERFDFKKLFEFVRQGDEIAADILEHVLSAWAAGIVNLIHAFDPEKIILSGGVMKSSDLLLPALQEKIDKLAWTPWGKVKLVKAKFSGTAALYGADYLVRSNTIMS